MTLYLRSKNNWIIRVALVEYVAILFRRRIYSKSAATL